MADTKVQDFKNHAKFDPAFHFFMAPVALAAFLVQAYRAATLKTAIDHWYLVIAIALLVSVFKIRVYSLKVQDRVIRLEEKLRMERLLPDGLKARIGELREGQFVALRFASDAELAELVEKTLANNWNNKTIKQNVKTWRPDHFRV
jgi:hypothetical protein